jgi:ribose transport system substrate-binding protein
MKRRLMMAVCLACLMQPALCKDKDINIVFIPKSNDQQFWIFMRDGAERAVKEEGNIKLTWRGPMYNDDSDSDIRILQLYTTPGIDAIIIAPTDRRRLLEPIKKAEALGIKVVLVDSALDDNAQHHFITTNNVAGGELAAEHLSALLHGQGNVLVLRTVAGSASTNDQANGFVAYLKRNSPKVTLVADLYVGGARGGAAQYAIDILKKYPQIDGIFTVNESSTDAMLRALRLLGLAGKKKLIGFDATPFLIDGLEKQEINGLVVQNPRRMGYLGIKAAIAAVKNEPEKERTTYTDATMVTLDNYKTPEIRPLLSP